MGAATRGDVTSGRAQIRDFEYNRPRAKVINSYVAWPELNDDETPFDQAEIETLTKTDSTSITAYGYRGREAASLIIKEHKNEREHRGRRMRVVRRLSTSGTTRIPAKTWSGSRSSRSTLDPCDGCVGADDPRRHFGRHPPLAWGSGAVREEFFIEGISGSCRVGNDDYDYRHGDTEPVTGRLLPRQRVRGSLMPDVVKHAWTHRPRAQGGTDPIDSPRPEKPPGCSCTCSPTRPDRRDPAGHSRLQLRNRHQRLSRHLRRASRAGGVDLSVQMLEDGIYHVIVYLHVVSNPTNGYHLSIVGGELLQGDDFNRYIAPQNNTRVYSEVTFRSGPDESLNTYAYVRTISGNASFTIDSSDTFMEIYKLGSMTNP